MLRTGFPVLERSHTPLSTGFPVLVEHGLSSLCFSWEDPVAHKFPCAV